MNSFYVGSAPNLLRFYICPRALYNAYNAAESLIYFKWRQRDAISSRNHRRVYDGNDETLL